MKKITNELSEKHFMKFLAFSLLLVLCLCGLSASAQTTATFNASGSFVTPAGVTTATVEAWGAGGAGGGSTSNSDGGGGGGGGAYSKSTGVSVSGTIPVTVGTGGVGDNGAGNNGGDSSFNTSTVVAKGGVGGSVTSGSGGPGGAGGTASASTGATKFNGGTGGRGRDSITGQGGPGGSSAGTAAAGTSGPASWTTVTASAAPTGGGKGGNGGTSGNGGADGTVPGGGGGGAGDGTNEIGGDGAAGRVIVSYTCPTYALTAATTATGPFCAASASVVTLTSSSMPNGTYTVTYNLTGGTTATARTASMTFASGTGTFTTSTLSSSTTPTTITITGLSSGTAGNGACVSTISTFNTVSVIAYAFTANAGSPFTKGCTTNVSGLAIGEASAAGFTYSWSPTEGLSSATVSNPTANPTTTTTYTVTKTYTASGCTAQASVTVTVDTTPPTAVAGADFTKTCSINPTGKVIGEASVAGFTYSWSPSAGLSSASVANPTANPTTTTTYTVTKTTTASGCSATAQITVTVDIAAPTADAGADFTKTCIANTSGLQIGEATAAGFTYSWSPATGLSATNISNPIANPTSTQTYTLTKTDTANGCSDTDTVTVTVNNTLSVNAGTDFTKTCTTNPNGRAIGEANVSGNTYVWSPTDGLSNANISNPTANPAITTTYTVTKTNTASGCVATDQVVVTVNLETPVADAGSDFTKTCTLNPTGLGIGEAALPGHTYSWTPTAGLSSSTSASPTANPTSTTTYTMTKTNSTTGCTDTDTVTVTVNTTAPTVAALTGTQAICEGATTTFASTTPDGVWGTSNAAVATVTDGLVSGIAAGTATINYTVTDIVNGCSTTVSRTVTVSPLPTSVSATGSATICDGNSTNLTGSATIPYLLSSAPIDDNFNGTPTFASAGTGTTFAGKNSGSTVGLTTITNNVDASRFMMASASGFGSATTTSTLTSAPVNTNGMTSLSFTYNHTLTRGNSGTNTNVVQVSTDNTNWTTVKTYTTNQGANNNFVADNINLNAYVNNAALRIRFSTTISVNFGTGWWGVDNAKLTGTSPLAALYSWTADTAPGTNGLPVGAATPSAGNASISVNPSATTNYTLVATDPITGCNDLSSAVTVTVNPLPSVTAPGNQTHCNGDSVAAIALTGTPGATYDISGGAAIGLANATDVTEIAAYTATSGSATITITPKLNGCSGAAVTYNVTVYATPTVTAPATQNYCNGVAVPAIILSGTPSGVVTYDISGGSAIGLADATGVTFVPGFTPITGSATISITPSANGCVGTAVTFTINVNPVLTPTFDPVASICAGGSLSALPTTSLNGISGSWSPALDNMNTTTYTFTADSGQCVTATVVTLTITVNTNTTYYADTDNDGYGDASVSQTTCLGQPENYVTNNTDCDDTNGAIYRTGLLYTDEDNDGYNNGLPAVEMCYGASAPSGFVAENNGTDCDDTNAQVNLWHVEVLGNGIDDNCDGNIDEVGPVTRIVPNTCGSTLSNIANTIYASTYPQATGYRFEVVNGANVREYDTTLNRMSLLSLPGGATYNTTYTIRVSLQINGFWQAYGVACTVTTPAAPATTNVIASQCGITLPNMATTIYCNQVTYANHYRFEVSDGVNAPMTFETPFNRFAMGNMPAPLFNTTYTVRVALRFGSTWQDYGDACNITTPETPGMTNLIASQCGITINSFWATLYANQVPGAQGYRFEVTNGATVRYFDTPVNRFALRNLSGPILPNTVYTIRVAILFNSVYQDFGSACTVTTSPGASRQAQTAVTVFEVKTSPNPFASSFKIDINTSAEDNVDYKVYDMIGKLIDTQSLSLTELGETELGAQYPSGVYNIIVTQGENVKTLRVIKR